jgi:hypothetical protein
MEHEVTTLQKKRDQKSCDQRCHCVKIIFSAIFVTFERYITNLSGIFILYQYQPTLQPINQFGIGHGHGVYLDLLVFKNVIIIIYNLNYFFTMEIIQLIKAFPRWT